MKLFSRADRSVLGCWWWTVDRALLGAILILSVIGVVLVTAAGETVAERIGLDSNHFLKKHIIILLISLTGGFVVSLMTPKQVRRFALLALVGSVLLMIATIFFGDEIKGARRWISIGGFSLQPSEFLKVSLIVVAAWLLNLQHQKPDVQGRKLCAGVFVFCVALLITQPDFGMTALVCAVMGVQIVLAGLPLRYLPMIGGVAAVGGFAAYFSLPHVKSRVDRFLDPSSGDNYQIDKSLEAFENGGVFGTGPGQGTVKFQLPDAHADFIFSVAAEEMGLIFVLLLIALYGYVVWKAQNKVSESGDFFAILAVGGLAAMFGLQAIIHMGSALQLLPTKGMTLPFVSYGGSSLLAQGMAMGMILALTRSPYGAASGLASTREMKKHE